MEKEVKIDFNKIEKMIKEMCPNGIEYKTLDAVTKLNGFKQIGAKELEKLNTNNGTIKLLPSSRNYDWFCEDNDETHKYICEGEVITVGRARNANMKYFKGKFISAQNHIIQVKNQNELLTKYLYYFLISKIQDFYTTEGSYPLFTKSEYLKCKIPILPLEVQEEIVRILDTFTNYTAELTAELTARKQQYEYYRDKLLSLN